MIVFLVVAVMIHQNHIFCYMCVCVCISTHTYIHRRVFYHFKPLLVLYLICPFHNLHPKNVLFYFEYFFFKFLLSIILKSVPNINRDECLLDIKEARTHEHMLHQGETPFKRFQWISQVCLNVLWSCESGLDAVRRRTLYSFQLKRGDRSRVQAMVHVTKCVN